VLAGCDKEFSVQKIWDFAQRLAWFCFTEQFQYGYSYCDRIARQDGDGDPFSG
jgi:hypothetical protein